jgi:hypothetical protein
MTVYLEEAGAARNCRTQLGKVESGNPSRQYCPLTRQCAFFDVADPTATVNSRLESKSINIAS